MSAVIHIGRNTCLYKTMQHKILASGFMTTLHLCLNLVNVSNCFLQLRFVLIYWQLMLLWCNEFVSGMWSHAIASTDSEYYFYCFSTFQFFTQHRNPVSIHEYDNKINSNMENIANIMQKDDLIFFNTINAIIIQSSDQLVIRFENCLLALSINDAKWKLSFHFSVQIHCLSLWNFIMKLVTTKCCTSVSVQQQYKIAVV